MFFFNDTATTEIYTLSLHDALPICHEDQLVGPRGRCLSGAGRFAELSAHGADRKSTRLNSSHSQISYAVFCLKKKNNPINARSAPCSSRDTDTCCIIPSSSYTTETI